MEPRLGDQDPCAVPCARGTGRGPGSAARRAGVGAVASAVFACALAGCAAHTVPVAAVKSVAPPSPTAFNAQAGPTESAAQLPDSCDAMLGESTLTSAFGQTQSDDNVFSAYAALPSIGRTGRVMCQFGFGIDMYGNQTPAVLTVQVATYQTVQDAISRVQATVSADASSGLLTEGTSVNGHPATLVFEPGTAGGASPGAADTPSAGDTSAPDATPAESTTPGSSTDGGPSAGADAGTSTSTAPAAGDTELFMADGNRTFSLEIPWSVLTGQSCVTALVALAGQLYANTLPSSPGRPASATASSGS